MGRPNRCNRFTTWRTYSSSSSMLSSTPLVSEIESIRSLTASTIDSISSGVFLPAAIAGTSQYLQRNTHPLVTVMYACLGQWRATGSRMPCISTSPSFRYCPPGTKVDYPEGALRVDREPHPPPAAREKHRTPRSRPRPCSRGGSKRMCRFTREPGRSLCKEPCLQSGPVHNESASSNRV